MTKFETEVGKNTVRSPLEKSNNNANVSNFSDGATNWCIQREKGKNLSY